MSSDSSSSGVPQTWIDLLVGTYERAQAKLMSIVLSPPGGTAEAQQWNQARAASQLQQIDQLVGGLRTAAASWVGKVMPLAMSDGIRRANEQAREATKEARSQKPEASSSILSPQSSVLSPSFSLVEPKAIEVIAKDTYADLNKAATSMGERSKRVLRATRQVGLSESDINRVIAGGLIEGKPAETIRNLREELRRVHGDQVQVIDKNGSPINFEVGYYAKMVAVTKTREANEVAQHERLSKLGIDLVAIDGRLSKNFCTAYLGMVFSISGKSDKYPALSELPSHGPPFHPFCSKSTRAFNEDLASEKQLAHAEGEDDVEKLLNVDSTVAQRRFKDLQIYQQVSARYGKTG